MTLVVGIETPDGVWLAGDRLCGGDRLMRGSKVHLMDGPLYSPSADPAPFEADVSRILSVPDEERFKIGVAFAGSARVAQAILRIELPSRDPDTCSLELWLTRLADTIQDRLRDCGLMRDDTAGDDEPFMAQGTDIVIAAEGRVFLMPHTLHWYEPDDGFVATGIADETWTGAYLAYRTLDAADDTDPRDSARDAWRIAQQRHPVGPPVDELLVPA